MSDLAGWLSYLEDLGWEDLYLPPGCLKAAPGNTPTRDTARTRDTAPAARTSGRGSSKPPPRNSMARDPSRDSPPPRPAGPEPELFAAADRPEILRQPVPDDPAGRAACLVELGRFTASCERCRLAATRNKVVFGSGDPNADLMFIGEGPGAQEDRQGLPFVGPAGDLLTRILRAIEMTREQVYIANIVKCRPPRNRDPQADEVSACRGYLERQIELIRPKVLVALGRVAAQTLLGNDLPLGKMRGEWWLFQGVEMRVTYHPAALLRNQNLKRPTWEDMQVIRDRVRELAAGS